MIKSRLILPFAAGLVGSFLLAGLNFSLVSWGEGRKHAVELFWQNRWIIFPIMVGFGIQIGIYGTIKKILNASIVKIRSSGVLTGASGVASSIAIAGCCVHYVTDIFPASGLVTAATFLVQYQTRFMLVGMGVIFVGIAGMLIFIFNERRKAMRNAHFPLVLEEYWRI